MSVESLFSIILFNFIYCFGFLVQDYRLTLKLNEGFSVVQMTTLRLITNLFEFLLTPRVVESVVVPWKICGVSLRKTTNSLHWDFKWPCNFQTQPVGSSLTLIMPCSCNVTRVRISSMDAILVFYLPQFPPRPLQNFQLRDVQRHLMYRKQGPVARSMAWANHCFRSIETYSWVARDVIIF